MNLGIKYCGGCNPRYDRAQAVTELLSDLPDIHPVYDTALFCPVWIVICGCPNRCVHIEMLRAGKVLLVSSPKDVLFVKKHSRTILKQDTDMSKKELTIGMCVSRSRTFTTKDLLSFVELSHDRNGIHLDPAIADLTVFRRPVVHGIFVGTLFSAILGTELPGSGTVLLEEHIHYKAPVFPGDTITAEIKFTSCIEHGSTYVGTFNGICRNSDGTEVIHGQFTELMSKRFFIVKECKNDV